MRLIFEPEAAYLAAIRGTDAEIKRILDFGEKIEQEIKSGQDRTDNEHSFHKAIAQTTHNEFMNQLMPILYQAIAKGVTLLAVSQKAVTDTVGDHRMIMDFLAQRNAEGAKNDVPMRLKNFVAVFGRESQLSMTKSTHHSLTLITAANYSKWSMWKCKTP